METTDQQSTSTPKYVPDYPTDHIRTKLAPRELHPAETFAVDILRQVPRAYLEHLAQELSKSLDQEETKDHPMGAVWESLVKLLNGEEIHGRFLMGLALYVAYTLFNVGATCQNVMRKQQAEWAMEQEQAEHEETSS